MENQINRKEKNNEELNTQTIKRYKGFKNLSEEEAGEAILQVKSLAKILLSIYIFENKK